MGDAALSAFLQVIFQVIADLLKKELGLERGLAQAQQNLAKDVAMIQNVLSGAEKMQLSDLQKLWFAGLRETGYEAMELLDKCSYEAQRRHKVIHHAPRIRNNPIISSMNPRRLMHGNRIARKIEDIATKIEKIKGDAEGYQIQIHSGMSELPEGSMGHQSSSLPPSSCYGREEDQKKIVSMLLRSHGEHNVEVLPIVGMAYIGKTTVAQLVFNDEHVSGHFELSMWVYVSHEFDLKRITKSIIEDVEGHQLQLDNLNTLQRRLEKLLRGTRYLLVLDDFGRVNWHDWQRLSLPLLSGAAESKIIVTTRDDEFARSLQPLATSSPYSLRGLSAQACWSLFRRYAVGTDPQAYNSADPLLDDMYIYEDVVKKCKGVPFRAAGLGCRLHQEKDRRKWAAILREENWDEFGDRNLMRALQPSYTQLDSNLKSCFAYSSIIPQNFQFEEEWYIQHWMAQGFIQPKLDSTEMIEDNGSSYFRALVDRSFLQRACPDHTGRHRYNMHEMMHKLALCVSGDECYILEGNKLNPPEKVRHLTVVFDKIGSGDMFKIISRCMYLHTLLIVGGSAKDPLMIPKNFGETFTRLRTLDVSEFGLTELPESIGDLIHLRYLQLRGTKIKMLPASICSLYNLQTLGLRNCYNLEVLPDKIRNLLKLQHLDLHLDDSSMLITHSPYSSVCGLKSMPMGIGFLTSLQTLSRFVISKRSTLPIGIHTRHSSICELARLNNLHGELIISNLHLVKDEKEAALAQLHLKFLEKLELSWSDSNTYGQDKQIIDNLKPHTSIKELTISGYVYMECPSWLGSPSYNNVVTVHLCDFKRCTGLPPLGQLPLLENLYIKGWECNRLTCMSCRHFCGSSAGGFRSLKKLHLERMSSLEIWDGDDSCTIPSLLELVVKNCCKLRQITHNLPSLTKITIEGSPYFIGIRAFQSLKHVHVNSSGEWIWHSWLSLSSVFSITLCGLPTVHFPSGIQAMHTSLQRLEISQCNQLLTIPKDWPPSNLRHLSIKHCSSLRELPGGIQNLTKLEVLEIVNCGQLTYLPEMKALSSLLTLEISDCASIWSLPYMGLPKSLQFLSINRCPELSHSCMNDRKSEIMRIFSVWIDEHQVPTSAS